MPTSEPTRRGPQPVRARTSQQRSWSLSLSIFGLRWGREERSWRQLRSRRCSSPACRQRETHWWAVDFATIGGRRRLHRDDRRDLARKRLRGWRRRLQDRRRTHSDLDRLRASLADPRSRPPRRQPARGRTAVGGADPDRGADDHRREDVSHHGGPSTSTYGVLGVLYVLGVALRRSSSGRPGPRTTSSSDPYWLSTTSASWRGVSVIARRKGRSDSGRTGRRCRCLTSSRRTTDISNWAKDAPRQRRTPPPNGIQV